MECITISTPLIVAHPDSDRDWVDHHHDDHHQSVFRLPSVKQPAPYMMPLSRNAAPVVLPVDTGKRRQVRHMRRHTVQNIRMTSNAGIQKRVRFDRSAPLMKPSSSPKNNNNTKSRKEWEDLLKSSIEGLQGLYNKIETPVVKSSPVLADRLPKPDLSCAIDHANMAFRALQIASGNSVSPSQYQTEEYDGDMSSGSEDSFDSYDTEAESVSPATPRSARMGSEESMELDSGFMGMGI